MNYTGVIAATEATKIVIKNSNSNLSFILFPNKNGGFAPSTTFRGLSAE